MPRALEFDLDVLVDRQVDVDVPPDEVHDATWSGDYAAIRFLTEVTPGAAHAARPACARSAQEWTVPRRTTSPPFTAALSQYGCTVLKTSLSDDAQRQLQDALAGMAA